MCLHYPLSVRWPRARRRACAAPAPTVCACDRARPKTWVRKSSSPHEPMFRVTLVPSPSRMLKQTRASKYGGGGAGGGRRGPWGLVGRTLGSRTGDCVTVAKLFRVSFFQKSIEAMGLVVGWPRRRMGQQIRASKIDNGSDKIKMSLILSYLIVENMVGEAVGARGACGGGP